MWYLRIVGIKSIAGKHLKECEELLEVLQMVGNMLVVMVWVEQVIVESGFGLDNSYLSLGWCY